MATTDLPTSDSPHLHLVVATPEENLAQQHVNSTEWRGALSLEAYLRREVHLADQQLTRDGGLTAWMLVYQPPDGSKRQVLCGCESIKKKALLAKEGKVQDAVAHGIASVFCPPQYRGRGYAGRMMTEVGKKLRNWQASEQGGSAFSVLYSDIGKDFYTARGWQPFPSAHVTLKATASPSPALNHLSKPKTLHTADLPDLCAADEHLLRTRLAGQSPTTTTTTSEKTLAALVPDLATLQWHHAREDFVSTALHNGKDLPAFMTTGGRGAQVTLTSDDNNNKTRAWCIWARVWTNPQEDTPNTLHILRLAVEHEAYSDFTPATEAAAAATQQQQQQGPSDVVAKAIAALLAEAQRQAQASGMQEVQIWNPTVATLAGARMLEEGVEVVTREEESIASLMWYGDGSWRDVTWVCNEKFGWC
ncbi:hypothetical protein B0A50_05890 [Salinomyces thailandicus]|uniref:LYC1 C-terminal domain-containing protein n=1 Tax=Salinomyces thailandicus TaxID=706561 RepID=A0A4U0TTB7_9PEZI|nr:hypothetical protein B0A50_05890 [Salinomyces thailandica]